jgi:hypothetical protein
VAALTKTQQQQNSKGSREEAEAEQCSCLQGAVTDRALQSTEMMFTSLKSNGTFPIYVTLYLYVAWLHRNVISQRRPGLCKKVFSSAET